MSRAQRYNMMQEHREKVSEILNDKQEELAILHFALTERPQMPGMGKGQGPGAGMRGQGGCCQRGDFRSPGPDKPGRGSKMNKW